MVDEVEGTFYRPPGGGVEFQEHSRDTVLRELREEFDLRHLRSEDLKLLGVIENSFEFRGLPHHEICFLYQADVGDDLLDQLDGVPVADSTLADTEIARVFALPDLLAVDRFYPEGVQHLLATDG